MSEVPTVSRPSRLATIGLGFVLLWSCCQASRQSGQDAGLDGGMGGDVASGAAGGSVGHDGGASGQPMPSGMGGDAGGAAGAGAGGMDATGVAGAGGTSGSGGGAPALGTLFCGDTPIGYRYTLMVQVSVSGSAPLFMKLSTWNCGPGTSETVTMTPSAEGAVGGRAFVFPGTINYLMATASDDSTFPALGAEFAGYRLRTDLTVSAWAKAGASVPPGFGSGGAALIRIAVGASASEASPCNSTVGVTFGLESFWAAAHPEALVYYDQGNDIWSAAGPTVGDHGAAIVLTPAPPSVGVADRVHIVGTKAGCKIDTGTTSGALQDLGFTGNIPVVADSISVAQAIVGP